MHAIILKDLNGKSFIYSLWGKYSVTNYFFLQNARQPTNIEIFGVKATSIPKDELDVLKMEWRDYSVPSLNQKDKQKGKRLYANQFSPDFPVIDKFTMEPKKWKCDYLVTARDPRSQVFCFGYLIKKIND